VLIWEATLCGGRFISGFIHYPQAEVHDQLVMNAHLCESSVNPPKLEHKNH